MKRFWIVTSVFCVACVPMITPEPLPSAIIPANTSAKIPVNTLPLSAEQNPVVAVPDLTPVMPVAAEPGQTITVPQMASHGDEGTEPDADHTDEPDEVVSIVSTSTSSSSGSSGGSSSSSASAGTGKVTPQPQHTMALTEIFLTDTGESILGADAPAAISADYLEERMVSITLRGTFDTAPKTTLDNARFTMEPGLLHQSLVGKEPGVRVTLDSVILLTPVSVSRNEIVVTLDTRGIPDLYLKGLHTLTVAAGQLLIQRKVKVGDPQAIHPLIPNITQVEVLRDEEGKPVNLRLTGKNLMLQPKFSYAQIDGEFGFGHQTSVLESDGSLSWQTLVHLPDPEHFDTSASHSLIYVTPFGAAFTSFEGN